MKRRFYAPTVLFIGLLSAQVVATAHVYLSNLNLLQTTEVIVRNGYLAVPNARVTAQLDALGPAMAGGLFFTLSIGAGLSLLTLIAAWLWDRVFHRRLRSSIIGVVAWMVLVYLINSNGLNPAASMYAIVVPLVTGVAAIALLPARTTLISPTGILWPVTAALILALLWSLVLDDNLFTNIRDHLLLDSRPGRRIVDAYYTYTLYPAEAYKSLDQKQIRTCILGNTLNRDNQRRLERVLRTNDYLPVAPGIPADLTIGAGAPPARLLLAHNRRPILSVEKETLLGSPAALLATYADRLDNNRMLRIITLACLRVGFPLMLFGLLFSLMGALPNLYLSVAVSDIIAACLCIAIGSTLLAPVYRGHTAMAAATATDTGLSVSSRAIRIAALRKACEERQDITLAARKADLQNSPDVAERYWLARSLAYSHHPQAVAMLDRLSRDPSPIVVCQALWAMGERKNRKAIPQILDRLSKEPHWYVQMYAYRALRRLGWVQPRSLQPSY
ncbi:hypothetical protein DSCO28_10770 [Desulfosarcina ovata subsp. sediminis]|uniref:HEAT repeat domain-containing protein n=1 Tax=Desulfosarcina ovata subsp. sediminis TaxID=885957 RepID=A0A5K7ZI17_9BACT|nr:HEAT repeat domain-containing protein [Desulfosarcina ovata]BBO80511.1 hypothetical protein DSCO28_10770 [Desulfosarcina ovata subsp. sediminis]